MRSDENRERSRERKALASRSRAQRGMHATDSTIERELAADTEADRKVMNALSESDVGPHGELAQLLGAVRAQVTQYAHAVALHDSFNATDLAIIEAAETNLRAAVRYFRERSA